MPAWPAITVSSLMLAALVVAAPAVARDTHCKETGTNWTWFSDHVVSSITYVVEGGPGRKYEVGTGISIFGKPRGSTRMATGKIEVTAWGLGALYVRMRDGARGIVCAEQGDIKTITFVSTDF